MTHSLSGSVIAGTGVAMAERAGPDCTIRRRRRTRSRSTRRQRMSVARSNSRRSSCTACRGPGGRIAVGRHRAVGRTRRAVHRRSIGALTRRGSRRGATCSWRSTEQASAIAANVPSERRRVTREAIIFLIHAGQTAQARDRRAASEAPTWAHLRRGAARLWVRAQRRRRDMRLGRVLKEEHRPRFPRVSSPHSRFAFEPAD